jgi:hypothetical protein
VVCFLVSFDRSDISTHQEWGSFAFKSLFSYRIFRFSCLGVVSPGRKMTPKFVQVRGSYTIFFFLLFMLIITDDPVKKNGAKFSTCKKSCG